MIRNRLRWGRATREKQKHLIALIGAAFTPDIRLQRLNELLEAEKFDEFVRDGVEVYAANCRAVVTPGLLPVVLLGYFEGIDKRGLPGNWRIRWGCGALWGLG